jgi:hypothetical protein
LSQQLTAEHEALLELAVAVGAITLSLLAASSSTMLA